MNEIIEIKASECALIYGGRSEFLANMLEKLASGIGTFAKLCYLANKMRSETLSKQIAMGDQTLWK